MNTGSGKTARVKDLKVDVTARLQTGAGGSGIKATNARAHGTAGVAHRLSAGRRGSGRKATAKD